MCNRVTYKSFIIAVVSAALSFCGNVIAQQSEFANRSHAVAPNYSPDQLRESLNAFGRTSELAKQHNSAETSAPASNDGAEELVFSRLPKVIPASSPIAAVTEDAFPVGTANPAVSDPTPPALPSLPMADAFPELPISSDSAADEAEPITESVSVASQSVSIDAGNPIFQESGEVPQSALAVPAGLRVPEGLMELPEIGVSDASPVGANGFSIADPQSQSIVSESLALPPGINVPLAEVMAGDGLGPVQQTPLTPQPVVRSDAAAVALPAIEVVPALEQSSVLAEAFSSGSPQALTSQQALAESPGAYGFQSPVPDDLSLSSTAPIFDPANPPINPVPQNSYPIQQHEVQFAQANAANAWQAPFTPTPGHNERNHITPELSLAPPPITGRPLTEYLPVQPPAFQATDYLPKFSRDAGHRSEQPIRRFDSYSLNDGEKFGYETKKREFPPFAEIIATGRFFYMAEALWAEPQFQANTLIATESAGFGESIAGDFDSDFHPRFRFGFESPYGPGVEFTYFNINSNSELANFTSDGITSGQTSASVVGLDRLSSVIADDFGEQLVAQHSLDIDSFTVSFFKELKFPISRVNGNFGFQYVSIAQELNANVSSGETLRSVTDMRAFGPRAIIEYYRPIGHTPLELVTTFGGSVLFGQRDQFVTNSQTGALNRVGADEFLTILDFFVGAQYTKNVGENRAWYGRAGYLNQTWLGGGSASFPQGDFGLRGFTFGIGYNR